MYMKTVLLRVDQKNFFAKKEHLFGVIYLALNSYSGGE